MMEEKKNGKSIAKELKEFNALLSFEYLDFRLKSLADKIKMEKDRKLKIVNI